MRHGAANRKEPDEDAGLSRFLPESVRSIEDPQKDIPRIAKDEALTAQIKQALPHIPTTHHLYLLNAREMRLQPRSVHLVVTSPPDWTLKQNRKTEGQPGNVPDYEITQDVHTRIAQKLADEFRKLRAGLDPDGMLASDLSRRLRL